MADPLGIVHQINRAAPMQPNAGGKAAGAPGGDFREELMRQIDEVNKLQQDASGATQDVLTGKRNDVEAVVLATQKADSAF